MTRPWGDDPRGRKSNVLSEERRQQVLALARLGWPLRRIQAATGVRRETARVYLRQAGIATRGPGRPPRPEAKPAISTSRVSTDFGTGERWPAVPPSPTRSAQLSACEPFRELIESGLSRRRNAMAIYQDLVDGHGFPAGYASVRRFVRKLAGEQSPEAHGVILTDPGEEGQVDYGEGPMVRHLETGKYRRARLTAMLDRLLEHGHVLRCGPRSWRLRRHADQEKSLQEPV